MKKLLKMGGLLLLAGLLAVESMAADKVEYPKGTTPVLMVGDSMMRILGANMEKEFRLADIQPAVAFSSLGSGLVRPSVFNWFTKLDELLKENKPKTVFVALGTNDKQALEVEESGAIINYGDAGWEDAYRLCIARVMDQLLAADVDLVVWFLLPPMKEAAVQEHAQLVNRIATELASEDSRKDKIFLFDMASTFSRRPGIYSQYMMSPTGEAIMVRDPDGVHLTAGGAKVVAKACLKNFYTDR